MMGFHFEKAIEHLSYDTTLKKVIEIIRLPERNPSKEVYEGLIRSIVSQQLSVKAAETIYRRFLDLFNDQYPHSSELLSLQDAQLRSVGLSGQKMGYVRNVATFFDEHQLHRHDWAPYTDQEIIDLLTQIKGVGKWTVQMILMFVLSREDVLPVLDLGIQQGMKQLYKIEGEKKALYQQMEEIATPWRPYRSIACLYLWAVKDLK